MVGACEWLWRYSENVVQNGAAYDNNFGLPNVQAYGENVIVQSEVNYDHFGFQSGSTYGDNFLFQNSATYDDANVADQTNAIYFEPFDAAQQQQQVSFFTIFRPWMLHPALIYQ